MKSTPIKRPMGAIHRGQSINLTVRISPELRAQLEALGNGNVTQGIRNAVRIATRDTAAKIVAVPLSTR